MRIAYFIPGWPPEQVPNGIATSLSQLAHGLEDLGNEVVFIAPSSQTTPIPENVVVLSAEPRRSLLERIADRWDRGGRFHRRYAKRVARALSQLCAERRIDIFEIEESHGWAAHIAREVPIPVVVRLHGPWFIHSRFHPGGGKNHDDRIRIKNEGEALRAASAVTAPSRNVLALTNEYYGNFLCPSCVIPNPAPIGSNEDGWDSESCDRNCILFVGRFDSHKGGDIVLDAFATVHKAYPDVRLIFVGPDIGIESAELKHLKLAEFLQARLPDDIIKRIDVRGALPRADIIPLRKRAFITVVSSRYENFPNAVLEAMAVGSPLVASFAGGIPELVTNERNGLLVTPDDAPALASAIIRLLQNPALAARLAGQAHKDCYDLFDSRSVARRTTEFYSEVIRSSAKNTL